MATPSSGIVQQQTPSLQTHVSLYIGDLHPDVTEAQLQNAFNVLGNLVSVRVCKDNVLGQSLGYGYANFNNEDDANRAIEKFNHTYLNGKMIRMMRSNRDSEARTSGIGNVFVKNLSDSIDNGKLYETFARFGNISSCKVAATSDGKSKGYGFVQFDLEESATAAISNLNGSMIGDKQIYVAKFIKRSDRLSSQDEKYTNLYMKNLDEDVTEDLLAEKFSKFGKIRNLAVSKDNYGNSRGFGFVNFDSPEDAKRAMETMNGAELGSKALYVARAQKKVERHQILRSQYEERRKEQFEKYKDSNVYVKNIDDDVDDDKLREYFSRCGVITSVKLMRDDRGLSRGFGFVCFSTPEEAKKAVITLHGYMFSRKPLYVAIAQRKEDRKAQLAIQFSQGIVGLAGSSTAIVPAGYSPLYYTPDGQMAPRQGIMYQPQVLRPGWRPNGFAHPTMQAFQPLPLPMGASTQHRQNRGRVNGYMFPQASNHSTQFMPHPQQPIRTFKDGSNQKRSGLAKYVPNGRSRAMNNGSAAPSTASDTPLSVPHGMEALTSTLPHFTPQQQKSLLGEYLYPHVEKLKFEQAAKITGMLLEMDNAEILLLLESAESLAAKCNEAEQVLKNSAKKLAATGQEVLHPTFLSSEVAVN